MVGDGSGAQGEDDRSAVVRAALAEAQVGVEDLPASLTDIEAIGEVRVERGTATVEVTLPVPSAAIRERLERGIGDAAASVDGVDEARVTWRPAPSDSGERVDLLPGVKNVIAVSSGKGGVGKSTVAANLAAALADAGASVGLLDADVYGPNAPAMFGLDEQGPAADHHGRIEPREAHGVRLMSMGFVVGEDDPVIWRGPMVDDVLAQLLGDVEWGALDYLVVDLPPGTGDTQLSLVQRIPVTGVLVVTTPQSVSVDDARRGLRQFVEYGVPVLGVVENMSAFACPDCEEVHDVFGTGGGRSLAEEFEIPLLGEIPLEADVGRLSSEPADPRGVSIPLVGRLELPRTREERTGGRPPIVLRDHDDPRDERSARAALRALATGVAARVDERNVRME